MRTLALVSMLGLLSGGCLVGEGLSMGFERMLSQNMVIMDPDTAWSKLVSESGIEFDRQFVSSIIENDEDDEATVKEFLIGMRIAAELTDSFKLGKWKRDAAGRNYEVELVTPDGTAVMALGMIAGGRTRIGMRNPETGAIVWSTDQFEAMGVRPHSGK